MLRSFTVSLEVYDYAIAYHCNYTPEVKNCGGYFGRVYPDGGLFGKSFAELKSLGNGTHLVELDEKHQSRIGRKPNFDTRRDQYELFRLTLFGYEHGVYTQTEVLMRALLACSDDFIDHVLAMAPGYLLVAMREFASQMKDDLNDRSADAFDFFSSTGTTRIPDANIALVRRKMGKIAG